MSIKGKVSSAAKKMIEATKLYEAYNEMEGNASGQKCHLQCAMVIDAGTFSHAAGYGNIFEKLIRNEDLGDFSGKGTNPVQEMDMQYRKSDLKIMRFQHSCTTCQRRKRRKSVTRNSAIHYIAMIFAFH